RRARGDHRPARTVRRRSRARARARRAHRGGEPSLPGGREARARAPPGRGAPRRGCRSGGQSPLAPHPALTGRDRRRGDAWATRRGVGDGAGAGRVNVGVVERFLAAFDRRWPTEDELDELLAPGVRFVERPNLINPAGSERDLRAMRAALVRGRKLLAWQSYE